MRASPVIARLKRKSAPRRFLSAKVQRGLRPQKAQDLKNYFGTGALGDVVISADTNLTATLDGAPVVRHYNTLTINAGVTLTTNNRCKGLVIYVRGDCTINGTLTMSGKGAHATPTRDLSIYRAPFSGYAYSSGTPDTDNLPDETLSICRSGIGRKVYRSAHNTPELMGTTGLAATRTYFGGHYGFGGVGSATSPGFPGKEAPGGGGGGNGGNSMTPPYTSHPTIGGYDGYDVNHPSTGYMDGGRPGARGGNGTAFSGGPGGGGGGHDSENSDPTPGNLNGGGPGGTGGSNGGGNGASGGGGVIFLIVGGALVIGAGGTISSDGTAGSAGSGFSGGGGGGSGGGRLVILYAKSLINSGVIRADGGAGGPPSATSWTTGGAGGAGVITIERIKAA